MRELNPNKLKILGNRVLIKHIRDEADNSSDIVIIRNSSNKAKTRPIGEIIQAPDEYQNAEGEFVPSHLSVGDRVGYFSRAKLFNFKYKEDKYSIVRIEDIEFIVNE